MTATAFARVDYAPAPTPYQLIGGEAGARELTGAFFDALDGYPGLAPLRAIHPADLSQMRDQLGRWMSQWLGGPPAWSGARGETPCILTIYADVAIDAAQARLWMAGMRRAFEHADLSAELVDLIDPPLALVCEGLRKDYGADLALLQDNEPGI